MARSVGLDWRRIQRWSLLGAIAMVLWLLAPVAACSWRAFRETPISDYDADKTGDAAGQADADRVKQGQGFWDKLTSSVGTCYARTPLLGQEDWKSALLFVFAGAAAVAWGLARYEERR